MGRRPNNIDVIQIGANPKKKTITIKLSIQLFVLHHYLFYGKIFKLRSPLHMFTRYNFKFFIILNN